MINKNKSRFSYEKFLEIFLLILVIIVVFALFDYFFHSLSDEYSVPQRYFKNKIIYGTLIGLAVYFLTRKFEPLKRALVFSAIVSVLLQLRYFLEGYPLDFVLLFLGIHFVILMVLSWVAFRFVKV